MIVYGLRLTTFKGAVECTTFSTNYRTIADLFDFFAVNGFAVEIWEGNMHPVVKFKPPAP